MPVETIEQASHCRVLDSVTGQCEYLPVIKVNGCFLVEKNSLRYSITDEDHLEPLAPSYKRGCHPDYSTGLSSIDVLYRRELFGSSITLKSPSVYEAVRELCSSLFFSGLFWFQLFCVTVWLLDKYFLYAAVISVISFISRILAFSQGITSFRNKRKIANYWASEKTMVVRSGQKYFLPVSQLVPDDVILISPGEKIPADCVLVSGEVVADLSSVTGETEPVRRFPLGPYGEEISRFSQLPQGSRVLTGEGRALVSATGLYSSLGRLFEESKDSSESVKGGELYLRKAFIRLLQLMWLMAMIGAFIAWLVLGGDQKKGYPPNFERVILTLDILTSALPPALPAAISLVFIFCSLSFPCSPPFNTMAGVVGGMVEKVVFDKTGTLTKGDLKLERIVNFDRKQNLLNFALATCHTLTIYKNEVIGSEMDRICLEISGWDVSRDKSDRFIVNPISEDLEIVSRYPFNFDHFVTAVVVRIPESDKYFYFVKGHPDKVAALCDGNFSSQVQSATLEGLRVIALAGTEISESEVFEFDFPTKQLKMLGFVAFNEALEGEAGKTVRELQISGFQVFLASGDAVGTAESAAKRAGFQRNSVHGRMTPDNKNAFICSLGKETAENGSAVFMIGDGPNDALALSNADLGLFVKHVKPIDGRFVAHNVAVSDRGLGVVLEILKQGRASLNVLIAVVSIIVTYAVIQATSAVISYCYLTNLTVAQYVSVDLGIILPTIVLFIVTCKTKLNLSDTQPFQGLRHHAVNLTKVCVFGIFGQLLLAVSLTYWKIPAGPPIDSWLTEEGKGFRCQANTALFLLSFNQIVISVWKFILHAQHSAVELSTLFMIWMIIMTGFGLVMILRPLDFDETLLLVSIPYHLTLCIFGIITLYSAAILRHL